MLEDYYKLQLGHIHDLKFTLSTGESRGQDSICLQAMQHNPHLPRTRRAGGSRDAPDRDGSQALQLLVKLSLGVLTFAFTVFSPLLFLFNDACNPF